MGGTPRCGAPSLAWEWNALAKKGGGGHPLAQKRGRGHLAAKKAEDNEVQWHHGMAGRELRNVPESGIVIIKMFHSRAAK